MEKHKNHKPTNNYIWWRMISNLDSTDSIYGKVHPGTMLKNMQHSYQHYDQLPMHRRMLDSIPQMSVTSKKCVPTLWAYASNSDVPRLDYLCCAEQRAASPYKLPSFTVDGRSTTLTIDTTWDDLEKFPSIFSAVFLGGASSPRELYHWLGCPKRADGSAIWSPYFWFSSVMDNYSKKTVRAKNGILYWTCSHKLSEDPEKAKKGVLEPAWNGGYSGPPVIPWMEQEDALKELQARKAYLLRVAVEYPHVADKLDNMLKNFARPRVDYRHYEGDEDAHHRFKNQQLLDPKYVWTKDPDKIDRELSHRGLLNLEYRFYTSNTVALKFCMYWDTGFDTARYEFGSTNWPALDPIEWEFGFGINAPFVSPPRSRISTSEPNMGQRIRHDVNPCEQVQNVHGLLFDPIQDLMRLHNLGKPTAEGRFLGKIYYEDGACDAKGLKKRIDKKEGDIPAIAVGATSNNHAMLEEAGVQALMEQEYFRSMEMESQVPKAPDLRHSRLLTDTQVDRVYALLRKNAGRDATEQLLPTRLPGDTSAEKLDFLQRRTPLHTHAIELDHNWVVDDAKRPAKYYWDILWDRSSILCALQNEPKKEMELEYCFMHEVRDQVNQILRREKVIEVIKLPASLHLAHSATNVLSQGGIAAIPIVFADESSGTFCGVAMHVATSNMKQFMNWYCDAYSSPTGIIIAGWTFPTMNEQQEFDEYHRRGMVPGAFFDVYNLEASELPTDERTTIRSLKNRRLSGPMAEVLAYNLGHFFSEKEHSYTANMKPKGLSYWLKAGVMIPGGGHISRYLSWSLPVYVWALIVGINAMKLGISRKNWPAILVDQMEFKFKSGDSLITMFPKSQQYIVQQVERDERTAKERGVWFAEDKRIWAVTLCDIYNSKHCPDLLRKIGDVYDCEKTKEGKVEFTLKRKNDYSVDEQEELMAAVYQTFPMFRTPSEDEFDLSHLDVYSQWKGGAREYLTITNERLMQYLIKDSNGVYRHNVNQHVSVAPGDHFHGFGWASIRPQALFESLEAEYDAIIPTGYVLPPMPDQQAREDIRSSPATAAYMHDWDGPSFGAGTDKVRLSGSCDAALYPAKQAVSVAYTWRYLAVLVSLLTNILSDIDSRKADMEIMLQQMKRVEKHIATFLYVRTFDASLKMTVQGTKQALGDVQNAGEGKHSQPGVVTASAYTINCVANASGVAGKLYRGAIEDDDLLSILNLQEQYIFNIPDDNVEDVVSTMPLVGMGMMSTGTHVDQNGVSDCTAQGSVFPGLTMLAAQYKLSMGKPTEVASMLTERLLPFVNHLASKIHLDSVKLGATLQVGTGSRETLSQNRAFIHMEIVHERMALYVMLLLKANEQRIKSSDIEAIKSDWKQAKFLGASSETGRKSGDMQLWEFWNAKFAPKEPMLSLAQYVDSMSMSTATPGDAWMPMM